MSILDNRKPVESLKLIREQIYPKCAEMAVEFGAIPQDLDEQQGLEFLRTFFASKEADRTSTTLQVLGLRFLMYCFQMDLIQATNAVSEGRDELARTHLENALSGRSMMTGYRMALMNVRRENTRRGANGRRLIGATSRDRARQAAEQYRGRMSRERASYLMSDQVGLSSGRIKKLLTELFPGDSWNDIEGDISAEVSCPNQG